MAFLSVMRQTSKKFTNYLLSEIRTLLFLCRKSFIVIHKPAENWTSELWNDVLYLYIGVSAYQKIYS